METLNFIPWNSPETTPLMNPRETLGKVGGQGGTNALVLEKLQKTNEEIETFLDTFGDRNIEFFIREEPLRREFDKPCSTTTIVFCPKEITTSI